MSLFKGKQSSASKELLFTKDFGEEQVLYSSRSSNMEIGHDWLGGWGLPYKAS